MKRLRPVDLAREAGISTQQVRNYEAAGILPTSPRTGSGYRSYGPEHLDALRTYRQLGRATGRRGGTARRPRPAEPRHAARRGPARRLPRTGR